MIIVTKSAIIGDKKTAPNTTAKLSESVSVKNKNVVNFYYNILTSSEC